MANTAVLAVRIVADASQATKGLDQAAGKVGKFQSGLAKAAAPAAGVLAAVGAFGIAAGRAASDLQQAEGAVESVFGKGSAAVKKFADDASTAVGLSATDYENLAAVIGSQLKTAGTPMDQLAGKTDTLIGLGADLAATFGGTTADAVSAISALMRGESDPIERYGVSIKQSDIAAQEASKGLGKLTGQAKKQADATAALELLTQQTAAAQGQFARESDSAAGAQQIATAQMKNATAQIGTALLPAMSLLATVMATVGGLISEHSTLFTILVGVVAVFAAGIIALNVAMSVNNTLTEAGVTAKIKDAAAWVKDTAAKVANTVATIASTVAEKAAAAASKAMAAAQWLLNAALTANPIGLVVAAIVGLIAVLILAWKKSDTFRKIVTGAFNAVMGAAKAVWDWIKKNWPLLLAILLGPFGPVFLAVVKNFDTVKEGISKAFGAIKTVIQPVIDLFGALWTAIQKVIDLIGKIKIPKIKLPHIPGLSAVVPTAAPAVPGLRTARTSTPVGSASLTSSGLTVNIYGALDPQQTGRYVQRLVHNADVRAGRRRLA